MGYVDFELWVECSSAEETERQAEHFAGLHFTLLSGLDLTWDLEINPKHLEAFGVTLRSPQLSRHGIRTAQDAVDMSEAGIRLYHHLMTAPGFSYARVAVEPTLITTTELQDFLDPYLDGSHTCRFSCILGQSLADRLGPFRFFREFRPEYIWNDYRGEEYHPLGSEDNPQLFPLKRQLLPAPPGAAAISSHANLPLSNGVNT